MPDSTPWPAPSRASDDLSRVEAALEQADLADLEEERVRTVGAVAALVLITVVLAAPAVALWLLRGSKVLFLPAAAGILGAAPILRALRKRRAARRLARNPIPPPPPTTQMIWLESTDSESDPS